MEPIPEQSGNEIDFDLATPGSRLGARVIDTLIGVAVYVMIFVVVISTSDIDLDVEADIDIPDGAALALRWLPVVIWAIYEIGLTATRGQTVGKMATKIKVINVRGGDVPPWNTAFIRFAVLVLPMTLIPDIIGLTISFVIGIWFAWDRNRQGLHDRAASTYVVKVAPPDAAAP